MRKIRIVAMNALKTESFHHGVEIFHAVSRIVGLIVTVGRKKRSNPLFFDGIIYELTIYGILYDGVLYYSILYGFMIIGIIY